MASITTKPQRVQIIRSVRQYPGWIRAEGAGQRVTLASLYYRGFMERQVRGGSANSPAYEYRVTAGLRDAILARRAA